MVTPPRILLIGTGRMAFHLGHALAKAKGGLVGIAGRNASERTALARSLGVKAYALDAGTLAALSGKVDLFLIAVSDDAIAATAALLPQDNAVVAHTSGAMSLDLLAPHAHRAVLWPIQTLSHGAPADLHDVPMIVEGSVREAADLMLGVARNLSERVLELPHEQRQRMHLAAVLASNFPVFLMREAQRTLHQLRLPTDLLMPLWKTTAAKVAAIGPEETLSGPARRGDMRTIESHLALLEGDPDLRSAYALLSELIMRAYGQAGNER